MHFERGSLPPRFPSDKQLVAQGAIVFAKGWAFEGIVSKRAGSFYKSGKSRNWLKAVNPDFVRT